MSCCDDLVSVGEAAADHGGRGHVELAEVGEGGGVVGIELNGLLEFSVRLCAPADRRTRCEA